MGKKNNVSFLYQIFDTDGYSKYKNKISGKLISTGYTFNIEEDIYILSHDNIMNK